MTRGERVRMARKTLGLTLEKFGAKIGLKKSSLSQVETGVNDLTESNIKAICREFNIDEKWLRDGVGSMFIESETFSLDEFAAQHNATDLISIHTPARGVTKWTYKIKVIAKKAPLGTYVWICDTGKKYHLSKDCSKMNNPYRVTISEAKARGYDACKKCYR